MQRIKVLFLIDHAPNYREEFLRGLGSKCNLIVVSQPCEKDNLISPEKRENYMYIELKKTYGDKIRLNFEFDKIIKDIEPDIICVALNLRHPIRIFDFFRNHKYKSNWVWWGQIFGKNDNDLLIRFKKYLIKKSAGSLVYTKDIVNRLDLVKSKSFDNSQFSEVDYVFLPNNFSKDTLNCLFVGRPQTRKRLELLFDIAEKYDFIRFRLVGPQMKSYFKNQIVPKNIQLYDGASGQKLQDHFAWSNLVINPGHVGLLVMNAACHKRPIVIDSKVDHAPEVILAKEACQYFIDFSSEAEVKEFFEKAIRYPNELNIKGEELYFIAKKEYTIEQMALKHFRYFESILNKTIKECK